MGTLARRSGLEWRRAVILEFRGYRMCVGVLRAVDAPGLEEDDGRRRTGPPDASSMAIESCVDSMHRMTISHVWQAEKLMRDTPSSTALPAQEATELDAIGAATMLSTEKLGAETEIVLETLREHAVWAGNGSLSVLPVGWDDTREVGHRRA
jgi:hypothetical protein